MNPHDEEIERVLGALKAVEPQEGMEARILQRLALRDDARAASPWRMRIAYALGVGVVFAAVALVVVHRPRPAVPLIEKAHDVAAQPAVMDAPVINTSRVAAVAVGVRPVSVAHGRGVRAVAVRAASSEESKPLVAESFPAPPLPLTEQEKMLLKIAHRGETQETELPTPLPLGTEVAALRAGADKFFEDPTTGENKWKQLVALQAAPN